jgi:signal transduction histidine kinase
MQKILIIDNDVSHLAKLGNLITEVREKSEVYQTANGQNALWTAVEKQPDLIMLSWNITDMNCLELIHKFKGNITTQNTPIIILTEEYVSLSEIEDALQAGAIDYLRKPIDQMELLARVNSGLKLSRLYQAIKRSEQALQRQRAQLDELLREQNHLLAIVSHDLRSPLNKALGLMQFLPYDGVLNEAQKMSINMIEKVLEGGRKLIDDILIINAKEADVGIIETQKIDMVVWLQNIVNTFKPHADHKSITLHLSAPPECIIHSNEENLGRIIDNLLSNAIKFSYPQKNVYITLENSFDATRVELSVKDEGQGMSEQDQQLMFKKFQKLSAKPTGNEHSTGLGLSIIKTLVTQLHGDIRVKSELGKGTTFTISLPTAPLA